MHVFSQAARLMLEHRSVQLTQELVMTLLARVFPVLVLGSGLASAEPATDLPSLPGDLPAQCQPLNEIPASAQIPGPATAARISVANCVAEVAMNQLTVRPDIDSLAELGGAVAASMDMLDDVIRIGDPYWNVIAQNAKHDLYVGMIVRTRVSSPTTTLIRASSSPWRCARTHPRSRSPPTAPSCSSRGFGRESLDASHVSVRECKTSPCWCARCS